MKERKKERKLDGKDGKYKKEKKTTHERRKKEIKKE